MRMKRMLAFLLMGILLLSCGCSANSSSFSLLNRKKTLELTEKGVSYWAQYLEQQEIGLMLTNITMQDSEPPTTEVMEAFKKVETAKQGKETTLNNAEKYRSEKLPEAEAEADQIIKNAEAAKQTRINEAEGQVARFNAIYEEYRKNPEITKERMYYEAMETVLPDVKLVIDSGDGVEKVLPLEKFSGGETVTADTEDNNGGE